ncbi:MAG TPA: hypothetical protein VGV09_14060 [Steroidobacteraceae bacterium]|nr:hypothetical protein [Steroidobacteraceae bacterium]
MSPIRFNCAASPALLLLLAFVADPLPPATAATASPSVILRAAAAENLQRNIEVRLRWSLQDGWLPPGGFNVYRSNGSAAAATGTPLNVSPLGAVTAANAPATIATGNSHSIAIASLLTKAAATGTLPALSPPVTRGASAQPAFDQLAAAAHTAHTVQATQSAVNSAARTIIGAPATAAAGTTVAARAGAVSGAMAAIRPAPTPADIAMQARRTLIFSAALHPQVAATLGLAYDDASVTPGQTYTYRLTSAADSVQLATVTITVPGTTSGLKPAAPTGLQAQQLAAGSIGLRWQRLSAADEAALGVAQYDIHRLSQPDTLAVGAQGAKLNDVPVIVTDNVKAGSTAASVTGSEAPAFFTDTTAPLTSVTYRLTVTDIFGRSSDPAQVTLSVQDWRKPLPTPFAAAQLMPQQAGQQSAFLTARSRQYRRTRPFFSKALGVSPPAQQALIVWTPSYQDPAQDIVWESNASPDPRVAYQIYRADTEQPNQAPVLITPTPILPAYTPASQLPDATQVSTLVSSLTLRQNSARDALATASCVQLFTSSAQVCRQMNAQIQSTMLGALHVYSYTDSGIAKDHYYQYFVVAVFTDTAQTSAPSASNVLAYPNLTPPDSVSGAGSAFQAVAATAAPGTAAPAPAPAAAAATFNLKDWSGPLVKGSPRDPGGSLTLSWSAGRDNARYEIYRANAMRQNPIAHTASPSAPAGTNGAGCGIGAAQACRSRINVTPIALSWQPLGDPLVAATGAGGQPLQDSDFVLLGSTTDPKYIDQLSRSSAEYYVYRIVPLNRWNVPGPLTSLRVRVPATLPPTRPKLLVGTPSTNGGAEVEFVPDGDAGEEIQTYELWRTTVFQLSGTTAAGSTGTSVLAASGAAISGATVAGTAGSRAAASGVARTGGAVSTGPGVAPVNTAARFGVVSHQSVVSDVVRTGAGALTQLTPERLASLNGTRVATLSATALPAGASGGTWLLEAPSSALDWRNQYVYWVRAIDSDQLQSDSDLVDIQPLKVSASAPSAVAATWNATGCRIDLAWQSTDPDTAGFLIERELAPPSSASTGTAVSSSGQQIITGLTTAGATLAPDDYIQLSGITSASTVSYADNTAFPDNSYLYRIRTVDQAGNESIPTVLAAAVTVPDGCGSTTVHQVTSTSSAGTQDPAATTATSSGATSSPQVRSPATATAPKPADQIVVPQTRPADDSDTSTPVVSPAAPAVPKPADDIEIPAQRPKQ